MIFSEISVGWAVLIIFSSALCFYISAYAWQKRNVTGAWSLAAFMLSVAFYSLGYALEVNGESLGKIMDALKFEVFWASFTAPAFLVFVLQFIYKQKISGFIYALLLVIPLGLGVLALTNDQHSLLYESYHIEPGPYFPNIVYKPGMAYVLQLTFLILTSFVAEVLLLAHLFRSRGVVRKQTGLILIAGVLPTFSAVLNPDRATFSGLDLQPFAFAISGLLIAISLFYFNMLDLKKIAREFAVDSINDYLLIVNQQLIVVDINHAGMNSTLLSDCVIGSKLAKGNTFGASVLNAIDSGVAERQDNATLLQVGDQHYQYSIAAISDKREHIQGYAILVNDYTKTANLMLELEDLAIKDGLTEIFNRRHLLNLARRELDIALSNASAFSVIIFDLDDFKQINDNHGHLAGDMVLKAVAQTVQKQLRVTELLGRYGGEEFCIVCRHTPDNDALVIAERIRQSIERMRWPDLPAVAVTASFGICTATHLDASTKVKDLLSKADLALYKAKYNGKNCCELVQMFS